MKTNVLDEIRAIDNSALNSRIQELERKAEREQQQRNRDRSDAELKANLEAERRRQEALWP